ncbi:MULTISPECIES: 2-keto-4-pentenoate hydratase [unclassified Mycobacterium]|uniref:2-keto-4-pentenoate hydratase n=1 Tax=unclassified Mycobacterium TaxID=2642494 RepID=UPI0007FCC660|nr:MULTISPECIES: fumarylacetoacetate hydrolase family protein [unclassified Mycobacterium]OBG58233.1 2-keto-4-pentenoate hydratase [Mycobacterium sp. E735]OBG63956.1 2-keto-4-pentenoate hydratase [Mycobacterium sp. E188]OBH37025.1 2-keto-4-pentenoate hydratase [Mycobacterium sp. E183]
MTVQSAQLTDAAQLLFDAQSTRVPIEPLTQMYPNMTVAQAYSVQRANMVRYLAEGRTLRGHKIGITSAPMQQLLGVDEPDFGYVLDSMVLPDAATVPVTAFCAPRVEPEVAFLMRAPLRGPGVTIGDVLAATEAVAPALEIVDSRIADWRITLADTVADNASSGAVVLGEWVPIGRAPALPETTATLVVNGVTVATGAGTAVLGHPAAAVAWLANAVAKYGTAIEAGAFVMSGSYTTAPFVGAGDRASAAVSGLGAVSVTFE